MAASAGRRTVLNGLASHVRTMSVGAKLIFVSTALTIVAISSAFFVLSVSVKRHTERRLAETLAKHQRTLSNLERGKLDELLRISTLMTDSPTLRAAMETFASESSPSSDGRKDLLATIQNEANKVALALQRDVLLVTDRKGKVLAAAGSSELVERAGGDLSGFPIIREVLHQDDGLGARNLSVIALDGEYVRVASAPITLSGFIIGTLTLGDRIDRGFATRLQESFDCDVTVLAGDRVITSTVPRPIVLDEIRGLSSRPHAAADAPHVTPLAGDDYVTASLPLGTDGRGHEVSVYLLHSLTKDLGDSNRFLLWIMLVCGASA